MDKAALAQDQIVEELLQEELNANPHGIPTVDTLFRRLAAKENLTGNYEDLAKLVREEIRKYPNRPLTEKTIKKAFIRKAAQLTFTAISVTIINLTAWTIGICLVACLPFGGAILILGFIWLMYDRVRTLNQWFNKTMVSRGKSH